MKVTLAGESFEYDNTRQLMSEALAVELVYKRRYAEWQEDLQAGSAKALAVLAWIIWRRDGRAVPFEDILSGEVDFDLNELMQSMVDAVAADAETAPDPTIPATPPDPAGTHGTGTVMRESSRSGSGSARGRSKS